MKIKLTELKQIIKEVLNEEKTFNNQNIHEQFIYNYITESQYIHSLNMINEGVFSKISNTIVSKITTGLFSFLNSAIKIGFKIINKIMTFINWILGTIKSFKEKHPTIFKLIIIATIVILLLVLTCCVAHAKTTGNPIDVNQIDIAIGYIKDMQENYGIKGMTSLDVNNAIAYLIKLKNNNGAVSTTDVATFGEETIKLANGGIKAANAIIQDAKNEGSDSPMFKYCVDLMKKGSQFVSYTIKQSADGGAKQVILGLK